MKSNGQASTPGCLVRVLGMVMGGVVGLFVGGLIGPPLAKLRGLTTMEGADGIVTMFTVVPF